MDNSTYTIVLPASTVIFERFLIAACTAGICFCDDYNISIKDDCMIIAANNAACYKSIRATIVAMLKEKLYD